jgi:hypothetical protein
MSSHDVILFSTISAVLFLPRYVPQLLINAVPRHVEYSPGICPGRQQAGLARKTASELSDAKTFSNKAADAILKSLLGRAVRPHDNRDHAPVFAGFVEHILT